MTNLIGILPRDRAGQHQRLWVHPALRIGGIEIK